MAPVHLAEADPDNQGVLTDEHETHGTSMTSHSTYDVGFIITLNYSNQSKK